MTFEEGLQQVKAGNFDAAVQAFREVTTADDQHHKAWNALGFTLTRLGRYEEAEECFQVALQIKPDEAVYLKNQAVNAKKRGVGTPYQKPSQSPVIQEKNTGKKTLTIILGSLIIIMILGGAIILYGIDTGMISQASSPLVPGQTPMPSTVSAQSDPQYERICAEGNEQLRLKKTDAAFRTFANATEIYPDAPQAWTGMGYALIDLGRYKPAIEAFDTALQRDPSYQDARDGKMKALEALGQVTSGKTVASAPSSNCTYCSAIK